MKLKGGFSDLLFFHKYLIHSKAISWNTITGPYIATLDGIVIVMIQILPLEGAKVVSTKRFLDFIKWNPGNGADIWSTSGPLPVHFRFTYREFTVRPMKLCYKRIFPIASINCSKFSYRNIFYY